MKRYFLATLVAAVAIALGIPAATASASPHSAASTSSSHSRAAAQYTALRDHVNVPAAPDANTCAENDVWCTLASGNFVQIEACAVGFWYKGGSPRLNVPFTYVENDCLTRLWLHTGTQTQCFSPKSDGAVADRIGFEPDNLQISANSVKC